MNKNTHIMDVVKYFLQFISNESCGKCTPCRKGVRQMLTILTNISEGKGKKGEVELLDELCEAIKGAALCALARTGSNSVISTLRHFRDELEAHINEKECPDVCKDLISYYIDPVKCQACMICLKKCPTDAIIGNQKQIHVIDQDKCTKCGTCFEVCPSRSKAVTQRFGETHSLYRY